MPKQNPTDRKLCFAREYIRDYNATAAAIRAGYSAKGADVKGTKLKQDSKVQAEIRRLEAERSIRYSLTEERLLHEIKKRALVNIADVVDEKGNLRPDAKRDDMSTITRIKTRTLPDGTTEQEVTLTDSAKYLDLLCKVLGMIEQKANKVVKIDADGNMRAGVIFIPAISENPSESESEGQNNAE